MSVSVDLFDKGQGTPVATITSTLAWLGVSSAGATGGTKAAVYEIDAEGQVPALVGYGPGPEAIAAAVRVSETRQVFARVAASIAGTVSSVTKSGSGPSITISGTPYDSASPVLTITRAGALGVAQFQLAMDGTTDGPIYDIPAAVAASVVGTVSLLSFTYSSLNTLTLIVTPDNGVASTCTFSGTTSGNFLSQINAAIGPAKVRGSVDQTAWGGTEYTALDTLTLIITATAGTVHTVTFASTTSGNFLTQINAVLGSDATASLASGHLLIVDAVTGTTSTITVGAGTANTALGLTAGTVYGAQANIVQGKYIRIVDGTTGTTSSLTIGAGTANTALGLTAGSTTGAASTYAIPFTNTTLTFPAGTYVLGETYTWTTVEPRFTATDAIAALTALANSGVYFRDVVLLALPFDGADARDFANQVGTHLQTLRAARPKVFAEVHMNSSLGTAGVDDPTNDADVKAAFQGHDNAYVTVAHGDCYMRGTAITGSFRRPAVYSLGIRLAAYSISSDPGNRELPALEETSPMSPDGVTEARNEDESTVRMESSGFTTMRTESGNSYFVSGRTRGSSPKFMYLPIMRTALEAARVLYAGGKNYENASRFLSPTGTIRESDAAAIENAQDERIKDALEDDLSSWKTVVDRTQIVARTNTLSMTTDIQPRGYFYTVIINIGVVDVLT